MPLRTVETTHVAVICETCGMSSELCARRASGEKALNAAVAHFKRSGWFHDPLSGERWMMPPAQVEREGRGRWYCATCRTKTP